MRLSPKKHLAPLITAAALLATLATVAWAQEDPAAPKDDAPQGDAQPTAAAEEPSEAAKEPQEEPAAKEGKDGRKLLLIGDSHTQGAYGWALDYMMRDGIQDSTVATYAVCASGPMSWARGSIKHHCGKLVRTEDFEPDEKDPGLKAKGLISGSHKAPKVLDLLNKHEPDVIVVALGENLKGFNLERVSEMTKDLAKRLECYKRGETNEMKCREMDLEATKPTKDLTCVWVLPHHSTAKVSLSKLERLYETLTDATRNTCSTIDSRPLTCTKGHKDPNYVCDSPHNYHLSPKRYRLWALGTLDRLAAMLELPLTREDYVDHMKANWGFKP